MKILPPLFVVDIIGEVVAATAVAIQPIFNTIPELMGKSIVYEYGRSIQITKVLQDKTNMPAQTPVIDKQKYPLIALFQDFPEDMGVNGYYCNLRIPKIVIATLTTSTDPASVRYQKTFKPILYPIYQQFLVCLSRHSNIAMKDPNAIPHRKWDRPGTQPAGGNLNDYIDAIEIENMDLTIVQLKKCK